MAPKGKGGLGKGLDVLIGGASAESGTDTLPQEELDINEITPNPNQPRKHFDEEELASLASSIEKDGLLQPIIVRTVGSTYQIVAGERRWHACKMAGLTSVPVRIVEMDDETSLRVALVENLQRSDLNPIEEARGYQDLMKEGGLTQAELAEAVAKSRSAVANALRLLDLPATVQDMLVSGTLSAGHARAVLSIPEDEKRVELANRIVNQGLSVREAENIARLMAAGAQERPRRLPTPRSFKTIAKALRGRLDTKVSVKASGGRNRIEIEFKDEDDLRRIYELLDGTEYSE